ncbi:biopolymer transporter ExbD [Sedimentitalea sp. JM2-8]|uniref:Biopolymer transporter ExbD n=1 Tax=Sedimentitalea xiamensis TaxID=3050037 RepID=A0ABT7FHY9_9RHOB|nr:biopolymer transporter ExbD [Sedimentitalea xiamensis]MDK3074698.1 biopolymer transporter ExbD [Sedimentitalea xiamensis]
MQFTRSRRRPHAESVVPMINVVFLLLIFFMMTARIAPAPPFDLTLPEADSDEAVADLETLYVSAAGMIALGGQTGEDAWAAIEAAESVEQVTIRADAELPARDLASILSRLAKAGVTRFSLVVRQE